jgi:DNA-binding transcriptional regulator YiaG
MFYRWVTADTITPTLIPKTPGQRIRSLRTKAGISPPTSSGQKIRNLRLKRHIQQKDLAKMIGIHKVVLCRYEKGQVFMTEHIGGPHLIVW